jgi:thiol-disulfide isomerase/thioredoxin
MVYLEINKQNNKNLIDIVNNHLTNKKSKIFIMFYMEGCGPCNQTRPEWSKLKNVLSNNFLNRKDIAVILIDKDLFSKLKKIKHEPPSFPNIRFITNGGEKDENYEDSAISNKDRTIDSFVEWIKLTSGENNITKSENTIKTKTKKKHVYTPYYRKVTTKKKFKGGKRSRRKYNKK